MGASGKLLNCAIPWYISELSQETSSLHELCVVCYVFLHRFYFKTLLNLNLWIYLELIYSYKLLVELLEQFNHFIWLVYKITRFNRLYVDGFFTKQQMQ